jgi:hypothetical protein
MYKNDADTTYSADDVIGTTLYAKKAIKGLSLPSQNSTVLKTYKTGEMIGVVYSYISHTDGMYWQIEKPGGYFYVFHAAGNFSSQALKDQGVLTTTEKIEKKEEENTTTGQKIANQLTDLTSVIKWVIIIALILIVVFELNKQYNFLGKINMK